MSLAASERARSTIQPTSRDVIRYVSRSVISRIVPSRVPGGTCGHRRGPSFGHPHDRRRLDYGQVTFTFCGYAFRPRKTYDRVGKRSRTGFLPAVAPGKLTDMSRKVASWSLHRRIHSESG
jgi:hypothetical protein